MRIRVLSASDLDAALDVETAIEAMRTAFGRLSAGEASVPPRGRLESPRGTTLLMSAFLPAAAALGAKIVSVFPDNAERDLPPVTGAVLLLDADTGLPRAVLDGTFLTARRTAAASALATRLLAPEDASVLALFGAGAQARAHVDALRAARPVREIRIVSRTVASAEELAAELSGRFRAEFDPPRVAAFEDRRAALDGADLVVTATTSAEPVFEGPDLEPGAHVNAIGAYSPGTREVDDDVILRARVVVDSRQAAWEEAGDLLIPLGRGTIDRSHVAAELGEIVNGDRPEGADGHELTLFKSVGNAVQDVALARAALTLAESQALGTTVEL